MAIFFGGVFAYKKPSWGKYIQSAESSPVVNISFNRMFRCNRLDGCIFRNKSSPMPGTQFLDATL